MASGSARGERKLSTKEVEKWVRGTRGAGSKLSDGGSLWLVTQRSGSASWQFRYSVGGPHAKVLSLGTWPALGLEGAREARDAARAQVAAGLDPAIERKLAAVARAEAHGRTFEAVAKDWLAMKLPAWAESHAVRATRALERDVYPKLGALPIDRIQTVQVSAVIEAIQQRGGGRRETAQKILQQVRAVFEYAQAKGWAQSNPAAPVGRIIAPAPAVKHHPALLTFTELGAVLRAAEAAPISPAVRLAHRLLSFTAVRISNAVQARWEHFDLDAEPPLWSIPRAEMKVSSGRSEPHRVVLAEQIATELRRWKAVRGESKGYVFPGARGDAPITREAVEKALRVTLGLEGKHSPHGWRAAFSTRAREDGDFDKELVDLALDHIHAGEVARAYDRGARLEKRIALMKWWADALTAAERGGDVVRLRSAA